MEDQFAMLLGFIGSIAVLYGFWYLAMLGIRYVIS
jgi:hypothetical protein